MHTKPEPFNHNPLISRINTRYNNKTAQDTRYVYHGGRDAGPLTTKHNAPNDLSRFGPILLNDMSPNTTVSRLPLQNTVVISRYTTVS